MSAFFVSTVTVKDVEKFQAYAKKAGQLVTQFGGEMLTRGKYLGSFTPEERAHNAVGIIKFPDIGAMESWYESAEYQRIIPLREAASDMVIAKYEEVQ
ncbi:DUF1330 domain-containing protein [Agaribacter marinus]|uniref:DUF1330 domain-containing protein n=1 Tax=Agaribacter marinus TaxID=1431249 RepID=A0AA37SYH5_9ALTE|nr:DUF1330 domain-containing protein [Agaribacter marinus]GLR70256.1 hypothetical protein GCM10007852_11640 [Agaribacter marinus]